MSYENAAATVLVATCCAACGRPLVDAESLASGMGPECRKKYNKSNNLSEEARVLANKLIYAIAANQDGVEVTSKLENLRELGLGDLADRIVKRIGSQFAAIISNEGDRVAVKTSFDLAMAARLPSIPGRFWDKDRKINTFPVSSKRDLFVALQGAAKGRKGLGPKGEFTF